MELEAVDQRAAREKRAAALSSVVAAVGLTSFKIIVGMLTGSLGILAEAAHSGLDLVAALVTFLAVRISDRPADDEHRYGHGKVENLSALFETFLLLVTCVWIIYEAIQRLFYKEVAVEVSAWSFVVMIVSIGIDFTRSRVLYRAAKTHHSQALEADALHFSTDIWSSSVVIVGLLGVLISKAFPSLAFLEKADAVAALGVALNCGVCQCTDGNTDDSGLAGYCAEGSGRTDSAAGRTGVGRDRLPSCARPQFRSSGVCRCACAFKWRAVIE